MGAPPKNVNGFTLLELITAILIVSLLSAIALPRFTNISDSATLASLRAIKGSLSSTVTLIRAEAIAQGFFSVTSPVDMTLNSHTIRIRNQGSPREIWTNGFENFIDIDVDNIGDSTVPDKIAVCTDNHFCVQGMISMTNLITGKPSYLP